MTERKQPWIKFYPGNWRGDPKLRMCSLAARGLWIDMLTLMHEATPYGHLIIGGKAPDAKQLAKLVGARPGEAQFLLNELEACEVFSRNAEGVIYSRRMVRDKEASDEGRRWVAERKTNPIKDKPEKPSSPPSREASPDPSTQRIEDRGQKIEDRALSDTTPNSDRSDSGGEKSDFGNSRITQRHHGSVNYSDPKNRNAYADKAVADVLASKTNSGAAWLTVFAARDPTDPDHERAKRECEQIARTIPVVWNASDERAA